MRIGSWFNKQAARPTELGASNGGGGVELRTSSTMLPLAVCNRPLPAGSWMSEREGRWCEG